MSTKSKAKLASADTVRGKSVNKKSHTVAVKRIAKARAGTALKLPSIKLPSIKTRTSLVGMKIYPASVEPSERVKPILRELANKSSAA